MINPNDIFGSSPKTVLNKPFFHAQDQRPSGTSGGATSAGNNKRPINTVIVNDIVGASLVNNSVMLPAGEYHVELTACSRLAVNTTARHFITVDGVQQIVGLPVLCRDVTYNDMHQFGAGGRITLAVPGELACYLYTQNGATFGLGFSLSQGTEVYADLKIWQLDRSLEIAPKAVNTGLQTVPSLDTTGNIMGFDISKTGANQLTITKGSCLDSTLTTPLAFTSDKTLTIPSVANTIYHIFCVKTTSEIFEARAYTSEAAVISDIEVDKFRWVGFWRTNGSSECIDGKIRDNDFTFSTGTNNRPVLTASTTTSYVIYNPSLILPISRISEYVIGTGNSFNLGLSYNGTSDSAQASAVPITISAAFTAYLKNGNGSNTVYIHSCKLRR